MRTSILASLAFAATAAAGTPIEPVTAGGVTISLPKGWKTNSDADKGVFVAQKDPSRKDAPAMLVMVQTSGVTASEDQLIDAVLAQAATDVTVWPPLTYQPRAT